MPFQGFEGPAGTGKTFQLLKAVREHLTNRPLQAHQKILVLTFMHGSRRRLEKEFQQTEELRNNATCLTIDSFAHSICQRWQSLPDGTAEISVDFDRICDDGGTLLERPEIAAWVAETHPIVVVDEAQELNTERLRIVRALAPVVSLYIAADEFQCLDDETDTQPFRDWFATGNVETLTIVHRTNQRGLLNAGIALRSLAPPQIGQGFSFEYAFPNVMPFKIAAAIHRARGTKAVIYAPSGRGWAEKLTERLADGMRSKHYNIPPIKFILEPRPETEIHAVCNGWDEGAKIEISGILQQLDCIDDAPPWLPLVRASLQRTNRTSGKEIWSREELVLLMQRRANQHRAYGYQPSHGTRVLSIHQAKNQQFENVILLWPPGVPDGDEQRARLLYNGITRAQKKCSVFVRTRADLSFAPFNFSMSGS